MFWIKNKTLYLFLIFTTIKCLGTELLTRAKKKSSFLNPIHLKNKKVQRKLKIGNVEIRQKWSEILKERVVYEGDYKISLLDVLDNIGVSDAENLESLHTSFLYGQKLGHIEEANFVRYIKYASHHSSFGNSLSMYKKLFLKIEEKAKKQTENSFFSNAKRWLWAWVTPTTDSDFIKEAYKEMALSSKKVSGLSKFFAGAVTFVSSLASVAIAPLAGIYGLGLKGLALAGLSVGGGLFSNFSLTKMSRSLNTWILTGDLFSKIKTLFTTAIERTTLASALTFDFAGKIINIVTGLFNNGFIGGLYGVAGGLAGTAIGMLTGFLLKHFGLPAKWAGVLGILASSLFNFLFYKFFINKKTKKEEKQEKLDVSSEDRHGEYIKLKNGEKIYIKLN